MKEKFHGKIWVLVDEYCYSATDALVWFCKETGFATVVGTKTGGNGKGAQPYMMALPYATITQSGATEEECRQNREAIYKALGVKEAAA